MGKGKGKGGCGASEGGCGSLHAAVCCGVMFLIVGPCLIAAGVVLLVSAAGSERKTRIENVKDAVHLWEADPTNGLRALKQAMNFTAVMRSVGCNGGYGFNTTVPLLATANPRDMYKDGSFSYEQLRLATDPLSNELPYPVGRDFVGDSCKIQVEILSGSTLINAVERPFYELRVVDVSAHGSQYCPVSYSSQERDVRNCRQNCDEFGGLFEHSSSIGYRCTTVLSFDRICIRIKAVGDPALPSSWQHETSVPGPGAGCYFQRAYNRNSTFRFLPALLTTAPTRIINVEVRAAYDPWLKYILVTGGTGNFGQKVGDKLIAGFSCLIAGVLISCLWIVSCYFCWVYGCSKHRPAVRPAGIGGFYYDAYGRFSKAWKPQSTSSCETQANHVHPGFKQQFNPMASMATTVQPPVPLGVPPGHDSRYAIHPYQPYPAPAAFVSLVSLGGPPVAPPVAHPAQAGYPGGASLHSYPSQEGGFPSAYPPMASQSSAGSPLPYMQAAGTYPPQQAPFGDQPVSGYPVGGTSMHYLPPPPGFYGNKP